MKTKLKQREVNLYSQQSGPCCSQKQDKTSCALYLIPYTASCALYLRVIKGKPYHPLLVLRDPSCKARPNQIGKSNLRLEGKNCCQNPTKNWPNQIKIAHLEGQTNRIHLDLLIESAIKQQGVQLDWIQSGQSASKCFESMGIPFFLYRNFDKEPYKCF